MIEELTTIAAYGIVTGMTGIILFSMYFKDLIEKKTSEAKSKKQGTSDNPQVEEK